MQIYSTVFYSQITDEHLHISEIICTFAANFEHIMQNVIIENTLDNSTMHALKGYLIHGLCTTGDGYYESVIALFDGIELEITT